MLSIALLVGFASNGLFGIWWADSAAALAIAALIFQEGWEAIEDCQGEES